jgi:ankyrin repeat protein
LSYILVALLFFFLLESILEYNKARDEGGWLSKFQLICIIVFSFSALLTSYPKLVLNTVLHETTRKDLIIPIVTAAISSVGAINLRIYIEIAHVFYKFRKRLLPTQWLELIAFGFIILFGIAVLTFLSSNIPPVNFATRYIIFIMVFICLFFTFAPKGKLYNKNKLDKLSKLNKYLDRRVEVSEFASSLGLEKIVDNKKSHKKVMRIIDGQKENERKDLKHRCEFLEDVEFHLVGNHFEPQHMEDDIKVLRLELFSIDKAKVLKSTDVKFKYFQSACKEIKRPDNKSNVKSILDPIILKAYSLQIFHESDSNELLLEISDHGPLSDLKELVTKRNPDINLIAENGWTPLLIAVANGRTEIVEYLLKKAADPNIANKLGASPLSFAALYGNEPICRILVNYGANVNHQDMEGITPLMNAAIRGHGSIAKYLLENGADPQWLNKKQNTALYYAEKNKYGDIARILRKQLK